MPLAAEHTKRRIGGQRLRTALALALFFVPAASAWPATLAPPAQYDPVEIARFITDAKDENQLAAIADEVNLFLLVPIARSNVSAERAFALGRSAIGNKPVPAAVLTALRTAFRDDNPQVGRQAIYAFGVLAVQPDGAERETLLRASEPELVGFLGSQDPLLRVAAIRVIGRVCTPRRGDAAIDATVSDAIINELNDRDPGVRRTAMDALGDLRDARAVQGLTQLFEYYGRSLDGDAALDALARIAHPSSVPVFTAALNGKSTQQRVTAIEGLARVGDATALPAIQAAADRDRTDVVALAVAFANVRLARADAAPISNALTSPKLRDQAQGYLAELSQR
ncbi:MAG TPA: HEAT repeat domain-containing protein [Vicinamibacterales bacterium]|nr:HEAT repeat domain-containing protein [Vicinamibacterales bacterium]